LNATLFHKNQKAIICIAFLAIFTLFSIFKTTMHSTDVTVNIWVTTIQNDTSTLVAKAFSTVFDTILLAIMSLIMAIFLFIKKHKAQSLLLLAAVGGNALIVGTIKTLTQVARPENQLISGSGFSYPSGHSAGAIIFIGLITYYVWLNWNNNVRVKILSSTFFGLMIALVGFNRIYLNVHWLSDVIGGCLFGAFWLSFCIMICEHLKLNSKFKNN